MEFQTVEQRAKALILNNITEPPSRLKAILKVEGFDYVVHRKGGAVFYYVRPLKRNGNKYTVKL